MPSWRLAGTELEFCNCDAGCSCNFTGWPTSEVGNCEGWGVEVIDSGHFDDVDLAGCRIATAQWWPGAIHEGGGRSRSFVDCETDEQLDALAQIYRGEVGEYFELFASTYAEPTVVERRAVDVTLDRRRSSFSVDGVGFAQMTPLHDVVSGEEFEARIALPSGFIWREGDVAQGERIKVDLPGIAFEHTGKHAVVAHFDWSNDTDSLSPE